MANFEIYMKIYMYFFVSVKSDLADIHSAGFLQIAHWSVHYFDVVYLVSFDAVRFNQLNAVVEDGRWNVFDGLVLKKVVNFRIGYFNDEFEKLNNLLKP